jgi:hypothetical protein
MYRVELQYDDISGSTQIDPRKIPHYPINDALRSVAGRNLVGLPWDALAAKQAQGSQAMLRDQALRSISIGHGVPEVHLGHASPDLVATHTPRPPPSNGDPPISRPQPAPIYAGRCAFICGLPTIIDLLCTPASRARERRCAEHPRGSRDGKGDARKRSGLTGRSCETFGAYD